MQKIPTYFEVYAFTENDFAELEAFGEQLSGKVEISRNGTEYVFPLLAKCVPPPTVTVPARFIFEFTEEALVALHLNHDPRFALVTKLIKRAVGTAPDIDAQD
jgi:hypothetical protein